MRSFVAFVLAVPLWHLSPDWTVRSVHMSTVHLPLLLSLPFRLELAFRFLNALAPWIC